MQYARADMWPSTSRVRLGRLRCGDYAYFWERRFIERYVLYSYESRKFRTKTEHRSDGRPRICYISVRSYAAAEAGYAVCSIIISAWALRCLSVFVGNARACNCRTSNGTDSHAFLFKHKPIRHSALRGVGSTQFHISTQ